jgi:hypothetical protein
MPCTHCKGSAVRDQFCDRVDEQGQLRLGVWRWASRCPTCGTMVYERIESLAARRISPHRPYECDAGVPAVLTR